MSKKPWSRQEILDHADKIAGNAPGNADEIESAIGMLIVGRHMGWKVMYLVHSQQTIKKYERILEGISIQEVLVPEGPEAKRSNAWRALKAVTNFWKAVKGEISGIRSKEFFKAKGT